MNINSFVTISIYIYIYMHVYICVRVKSYIVNDKFEIINFKL